MDRRAVHDELETARAAFHRLVEGGTEADLHRASAGTRWTNEQLLFHMLFGYLITRVLLVLARPFARPPAGASRGFARLLDAAAGPCDVVNYYGSCAGTGFSGRRRMVATFDRVIASLHRQLAAETKAGLRRGMYYPARWDPFFRHFMTLADTYYYLTQHFSFHQQQLTLDDASRRHVGLAGSRADADAFSGAGRRSACTGPWSLAWPVTGAGPFI